MKDRKTYVSLEDILALVEKEHAYIDKHVKGMKEKQVRHTTLRLLTNKIAIMNAMEIRIL